MMNKNNHPFHMVDFSPWPIKTSILMILMMSSLIEMMNSNNLAPLMMSTLIMMLIMWQWWRDITREASYQGIHTLSTLNNMKWGMILFITSEILFFISFFWMFLHSSLSINIDTGLIWPPKSLSPFNPTSIPLLNTLILLSSGVTLTASHNLMMKNKFSEYKMLMMTTIMLGIYFSALQMMEYKQAPFTISDSTFGAAFFISTGFHGIHVIIGSSFLLITLTRMMCGHMQKNHHFGMEAASWYWHFVDVVWLLLFTLMYWWIF